MKHIYIDFVLPLHQVVDAYKTMRHFKMSYK